MALYFDEQGNLVDDSDYSTGAKSTDSKITDSKTPVDTRQLGNTVTFDKYGNPIDTDDSTHTNFTSANYQADGIYDTANTVTNALTSEATKSFVLVVVKWLALIFAIIPFLSVGTMLLQIFAHTTSVASDMNYKHSVGTVLACERDTTNDTVCICYSYTIGGKEYVAIDRSSFWEPCSDGAVVKISYSADYPTVSFIDEIL